MQRSRVRCCHQDLWTMQKLFCMELFATCEWSRSSLSWWPNLHINQWKCWDGQHMFNKAHNFYSLSVQSFIVNNDLGCNRLFIIPQGFPGDITNTSAWCQSRTALKEKKKRVLEKLERFLFTVMQSVNELCNWKCVSMDLSGCRMNQRRNDTSWNFCFRLWAAFGIHHYFQLLFFEMSLWMKDLENVFFKGRLKKSGRLYEAKVNSFQNTMLWAS